jgi:PE family protein/PPE family protein
MSFVKALPEALAAAAGQLQGIGTSMTAQNAAIAAPTTGVIPAAADEVSALQATQFSAYGSLYQSISAEAQAIHEMFVSTLGTSASSYGATEAANTTAASLSSSGGGSILDWLGVGSSTEGINGAISQMVNIGGGNWASAMSNLVGMAGGGLLPAAEEAEAAVGAEAGGLAAGLGGGLDGAALSGAVGPAGFGGMPVLAGLGQASSIGGVSVPPSWAGQAIPAASATPATLAGAGWTTAAPQAAPVTTMPAGMPSVASAGRGGYGFGAPRYGVKPTVMPKPAVV